MISGMIQTSGGASSAARALACNALVLPYQLETSATTSYVRNYKKAHRVASNANFSSIKLVFVNWASTSTTDSYATTPTINLQVGIEYSGTLYPVTFSGASSANVAAGAYVESDPVAGLTLPAGALFYERVTMTGPDTGTYNYPGSQVTNDVWGEFFVAGTDTAVNFATGGLGMGATGTATVAAGSITVLNLTAGGSGYTATGYVMAYEVGTDGVMYSKQVGTAQVSGGVVTGMTLTSGTPPSGLAAWVSPSINIVYGHSLLGLTSDIRCYSSSLISGIPSVPVKSLLMMGDSIVRGNGTALVADANQNQGLYEVGLNNRCGVANFGIGSATARKLDDLTVSYPKMYGLIADYADLFTHALLAAGSNDINTTADTAATIKTNLETIANHLRGLGMEVAVCPIICRTNSTDSWATLANQTPRSGFGTGERRDEVNAYIRDGTILSDWQYPDADAICRDATEPTKWRVDFVATPDGAHDAQLMRGAARASYAFKLAYWGLE